MVSGQNFGDGQSGMLNPNLFAVLDDVAGDVGFTGNRAALENSDSPQPGERNFNTSVLELSAQRLLNHSLGCGHSLPCDHYASGFGQRDLAAAVDGHLDPLRNTAPQVDEQTIAGTEDVIGASGHVHRKKIGVAGSMDEDAGAKALQPRLLAGKLAV